MTSNPSPLSFDLELGSSNCDRYFASFAFKSPRWYSVAKRWPIVYPLIPMTPTFVFLCPCDFLFDLCYLVKNTHFSLYQKINLIFKEYFCANTLEIFLQISSNVIFMKPIHPSNCYHLMIKVKEASSYLFFSLIWPFGNLIKSLFRLF